MMKILQNHARFGDGRPRRRVNRPDAVHASDAQQQLMSAGIGRRAAYHAAVAALGNQRDPCIGA